MCTSALLTDVLAALHFLGKVMVQREGRGMNQHELGITFCFS